MDEQHQQADALVTLRAVGGGGAKSLFVRHAAFGGILHVLDIFVQRPSCRLVRWHGPLCPTVCHLLITDGNVKAVLLRIDDDDVAVLNQADRATFLSFGYDMTDEETV